ncbi:MAG: hypothetical protein Q7S81_02390 [bacterium]|nr:hypothetical protein [bacterium]
MKQKLYKILSVLLKNLLIFLIGGLLAIAATLLCAEPLLKAAIKQDVGLGIIAVAPVLIVIYGIIFGIAGGIISVITYNLIKFIKQRKAPKSN